ncbi:GRE2 [Candida pseudojiufengensis]|uniref:GRE2 n=1 Tax=Candida pseudojiufengensis TaxID=497109 RepID=UPI0022242DC7|nr:GRE2 [Candida pseudojiufengensis]KAI5963150.1 GRE2 [Candida pseudojiufengensis]
MTKVIVSGGTGFIAQHILNQLIKSNNNYNVVFTSRSKEKGDKVINLFEKPKNLSYEIVEDVAAPRAFDHVLQHHSDASVFLHTASPFHFKTTDPEILIKPAVEGTKNVFLAIEKYGKNIKKVVVTSSYASIARTDKKPTDIITEKDWNTQTTPEEIGNNPVFIYRASKSLAEQEAWSFIKNHQVNFKLSTINPVFVFGPQLFDSEVKSELNTSSEVINKIINLKPDDKIPPFKGGWIDVRDVAKAHLLAFEKNDAEGERIILYNGNFTDQTILDFINSKFPKLNLPKGDPGSDKKALESVPKVDDSKSRRILGFKYIDFDTSIDDSVKQILKAKGEL